MFFSAGLVFFLLQPTPSQEDGTGPFLVSTRHAAWRYGPKYVVHPGCAAVYRTFEHELTALVLPIDKVLAQGIVMNNAHAALSSEAGIAIVKDHGHLTTIPARSALWVPFGAVVIVINWQDEAATHQRNHSANAEHLQLIERLSFRNQSTTIFQINLSHCIIVLRIGSAGSFKDR